MFSSCSSDDIEPALRESTFTDKSGLKLTYNGSPMIGKTAHVVPTAEGADITLFSVFDLAQLGVTGLSGTVDAAGVIPGSKSITLPVKLTSDGKESLFSGKAESDYATFTYSGNISSSGLELNLRDVVLKGGGVSPTVWKPAKKIITSTGMSTDGPVVADWQYEPLPDVNFDFSDLLRIMVNLPVIKDKDSSISLNEAILTIINSIALLPDGNVVITYATDAFGAPQVAQTYPNRFQYVVTRKGEIRFFSDPMLIFGLMLVNFSGSIPANWVQIKDGAMMPTANASDEGIKLPEWIQGLIPSMLTTICQSMGEGIPALYSPTTNGMEIYINSEIATVAIVKFVETIAASPEMKQLLSKIMISYPELEPLVPKIDYILSLVPQIIERTNTLKIGIALSPATL